MIRSYILRFRIPRFKQGVIETIMISSSFIRCSNLNRAVKRTRMWSCPLAPPLTAGALLQLGQFHGPARLGSVPNSAIGGSRPDQSQEAKDEMIPVVTILRFSAHSTVYPPIIPINAHSARPLLYLWHIWLHYSTGVVREDDSCANR